MSAITALFTDADVEEVEGNIREIVCSLGVLFGCIAYHNINKLLLDEFLEKTELELINEQY